MDITVSTTPEVEQELLSTEVLCSRGVYWASTINQKEAVDLSKEGQVGTAIRAISLAAIGEQTDQIRLTIVTVRPRILSAIDITASSLVGTSRVTKASIGPLETVVASVSTRPGLTTGELITVLTDPVSLTGVEKLIRESLIARVEVGVTEAITKPSAV